MARTDRDWLHLLRRRGSDPFMAFCERRIGRIRNYPPPARHSVAADPFSPAVGLQELYKSVMIGGFLLPSELAVTGGQNSARSKPASPPLKLSIWRYSRSPARKARGSERVAVESTNAALRRICLLLMMFGYIPAWRLKITPKSTPRLPRKRGSDAHFARFSREMSSGLEKTSVTRQKLANAPSSMMRKF